MSESGFRRPWMAKLRRRTSRTSGIPITAPAARRTPSCEIQLLVPAARMTPSCEIRLPSRTPATSHTSSCGVGARCIQIAAVLVTIFREFMNEFVAFWESKPACSLIERGLEVSKACRSYMPTSKEAKQTRTASGDENPSLHAVSSRRLEVSKFQ